MKGVGNAIRSVGAQEPKILNLSMARISHPLPGDIWINDPYLYRLLWASGTMPTTRVVDAISSKSADGILVTRGALGSNDDVHRAVAEAYRVAFDFGPIVYLVPKAP
jgi:hypothetical protein